MPPTPVILITGHPATGKTTLAEYLSRELSLPLVSKDQYKEILLTSLEGSGDEWSRQLSALSMRLLYMQVETLLRAGVAHIAEANFHPALASQEWQNLGQRYPLRLIQVRCETEPGVLLRRYEQRITNGERHPGHHDQSHDPKFLEKVRSGPTGWIEVEGPRIAVDTTHFERLNHRILVEEIRLQLTSSY